VQQIETQICLLKKAKEMQVLVFVVSIFMSTNQFVQNFLP